MGSFPPFVDIGGPVAQNHYGPPLNLKQSFISRFRLQVGTVSVGDVLMADTLGSDAGATTQDNAATSQHGVLIAPSAGLIINTAPGFVVVVTDLLGGAGADNTDVLACWFGPCVAGVVGGGGDMTIDSPLIVTTAKRFDIVVATGERHFAQGASTLSAVTTVQYGLVFLHNNQFPYCHSQAA